MIRYARIFVVELLLCAMVSLPLGSCSILLPVSAIQANRRYPPGVIDLPQTTRLPGRPRVAIVVRDDHLLRGLFMGLHPMREEAYRARYAAWRAGGDGMPELGEGVTLVMARGRDRAGRFQGFGVASVRMTVGRHDTREYPMQEFRVLRLASGLELPSDSLRARATELPMNLNLALYMPDGVPPEAEPYRRARFVARVPLDDVRRIEILGPVASPALSFFGGALIDGLFVLAVAAGASASGGGCEYSGAGLSFP